MQQQYSDAERSNTGWVKTSVAAAALGVKPRQVRNYISEGLLEATTEGEGVNRRYLVSIASIEALRSERHSEGKLPGQGRDVAEDAAEMGHAPEETVALVRELAVELSHARYQLGRVEAQVELTSQAESTIREQLERERDRAERLEAERDKLLPDLLRQKDLINAERERTEQLEAQLREALESRRGWFRRFFGF